MIPFLPNDPNLSQRDRNFSELTDMGIARNTSEFKQKIQQKREQKS
jgi:hypothetical protein